MRNRWLPFLPWLAVWLCAASWLSTHVGPRQPIAVDEPHAVGFLSLYDSVLAGQDTLSHDYPATWWGWSQIRQTGQIPLWNPSWFGGEPFVASQTFMPFYPPNWLSMFLSFPFAFNVQYPLHLLIAAMAMAWACRRRGFGWVAAGLAGLSWGFGGHLATLVGPGHIQKLQTLAWLPIVTTGMRELAGDNPRRGVVPFAIGLALQVTAGHLQIVWLTLLAGGLEFIAVFIPSLRAPQSAFRNFGWGAFALIFALGLSAIFWVPTVEFARLSNREGRLSWEDLTRGSLPPEEAVEFALPRLLGDSVPNGRGAYLGRYGESVPDASLKLTPERVVSDYVGAGVLIFALISVGMISSRRKQAVGYILLAAFALLLSMGRYLPGFYKFALAVIPGLSHFRSPSTMMALFSYGLIMAAAVGLDGFLKQTPSSKSAKAWAMGLLAVSAVALLAAHTVILPALLTPHEIKRILLLRSIDHVMQGLGYILLPAGLLALVSISRSSLMRRMSAALIVVMAVMWGRDLLRNDRAFWSAEPYAPYHAWMTNHWALDRWNKEDVPVRYLHINNELSNQALTLSDYAKFREIGSVHGYHPVTYGRYSDLLRRLGFLHLNFARLFGMQYMIAAPGPGIPPRGWETVESHGDLLLMKNPGVDYIRQVRHIKVVPDWTAVLDRLAEPGFNAYESTSITYEDAQDPKTFGRSWPQKDIHLQARVFPARPGHTELRLTATDKGYVALAEPAAPGWRLWAGTEDVSKLITRLDGYFIGIYIPAGQHTFQLEYDPASQRLGLHLTLLSLALIGFLIGYKFKRFAA